jgi:hypothetical protein
MPHLLFLYIPGTNVSSLIQSKSLGVATSTIKYDELCVRESRCIVMAPLRVTVWWRPCSSTLVTRSNTGHCAIEKNMFVLMKHCENSAELHMHSQRTICLCVEYLELILLKISYILTEMSYFVLKHCSNVKIWRACKFKLWC